MSHICLESHPAEDPFRVPDPEGGTAASFYVEFQGDCFSSQRLFEIPQLSRLAKDTPTLSQHCFSAGRTPNDSWEYNSWDMQILSEYVAELQHIWNASMREKWPVILLRKTSVVSLMTQIPALNEWKIHISYKNKPIRIFNQWFMEDNILCIFALTTPNDSPIEIQIGCLNSTGRFYFFSPSQLCSATYHDHDYKAWIVIFQKQIRYGFAIQTDCELRPPPP